MNKELSPVSAAELEAMMDAELEEDLRSREYLGDAERVYMGSLCTKIMRKILENRRTGYVQYCIESNTDSEEVPTFPFWLENRAEFVKNYFTKLGYKVTTERDAEDHGFGDWTRWYCIHVTITWRK